MLTGTFWRHVVFSRRSGCWLWTGYTTERGYGQVGGRVRGLVHRLAYENLVGPVPLGLELDHLCRQPACLNPDHLEPVTHAENVRRGLAGKVNNHNTRRDKCPQGHPLVTLSGQRGCPVCKRRSNREYMRRVRRLRREAAR